MSFSGLGGAAAMGSAAAVVGAGVGFCAAVSAVASPVGAVKVSGTASDAGGAVATAFDAVLCEVAATSGTARSTVVGKLGGAKAAAAAGLGVAADAAAGVVLARTVVAPSPGLRLMTLPASKMMRMGLLASRNTRSLNLASGAEAAEAAAALVAALAVCACAVPQAPQRTPQPKQAEHKTRASNVRMAPFLRMLSRWKPWQTPGAWRQPTRRRSPLCHRLKAKVRKAIRCVWF